MLKRYEKKGCPTDFPVRTKCILLFQKIHGVDVLLFGVYVYEYGHDCPAPNRRRVYISYLDSVNYFEPRCFRTTVYHQILIEYLRFVKKRGFHTAHIWSCPPSKGDDYIFYSHPQNQLTPKDEMLCKWYHNMLEKAEEEGVVMSTQLLYDVYFANKGKDAVAGQALDPTSIPYFEGDYIPGELENIIKDVISHEEAKKKERESLSSPGPVGAIASKVTGRKRGTRSNPGELVNQEQDKVMLRLGQALTNMKQNFIVANLLSRDFAAAVERGEDVSNWVEDEEEGAKKSVENQSEENEGPKVEANESAPAGEDNAVPDSNEANPSTDDTETKDDEKASEPTGSPDANSEPVTDDI